MAEVKHLKVPRQWAEQLEEIAAVEGYTGSAKWAKLSKHLLKKKIDDSLKEADAVPLEVAEHE